MTMYWLKSKRGFFIIISFVSAMRVVATNERFQYYLGYVWVAPRLLR